MPFLNDLKSNRSRETTVLHAQRMNIIHLMCIENLRTFRRAQDSVIGLCRSATSALHSKILALRPLCQLLLGGDGLSRELIRVSRAIFNISAVRERCAISVGVSRFDTSSVHCGKI
jgi:hypothetical protein